MQLDNFFKYTKWCFIFRRFMFYFRMQNTWFSSKWSAIAFKKLRFWLLCYLFYYLDFLKYFVCPLSFLKLEHSHLKLINCVTLINLCAVGSWWVICFFFNTKLCIRTTQNFIYMNFNITLDIFQCRIFM